MGNQLKQNRDICTIEFITQSAKKLQTTIDDNYLYPLLASTKLSLLQQQPLMHRQ